MRLLTRIGVATAATTLASAAALSGAGVAGAQFGDTGSVSGDNFTMRSNSTLDISRTTTGLKVSYTNKTDRDLLCYGLSAPASVIGAFAAHVAEHGVESLSEEANADFEDRLEALDIDQNDEDLVGQMFMLFPGGLVQGVEGGITLPGSGDLDGIIEAGESEDWTFDAPGDYNAGAAMFCGEPNLEAVEMEDSFSYGEFLTTHGGVPAGLGSLDAALTGIGSSGSVARTTGSLGS